MAGEKISEYINEPNIQSGDLLDYSYFNSGLTQWQTRSITFAQLQTALGGGGGGGDGIYGGSGTVPTSVISTITDQLTFSSGQFLIEDNGDTSINQFTVFQVNSDFKAIRVPRITDLNSTLIAPPVEGMIYYNTDQNQFYGYNDSNWIILG